MKGNKKMTFVINDAEFVTNDSVLQIQYMITQKWINLTF